MYYYYVYITMIVYFLTDVMKWLRGKWNQLMKLVIPVWSSIGQDFCVPSMHMKGFYVSAIGAIQGHHGPLVAKMFSTL